MSINDTLLVECVRAHPEIYDKGHAGFKNAGIKDSAWKIVAETVNGRLCCILLDLKLTVHIRFLYLLCHDFSISDRLYGQVAYPSREVREGEAYS